MIYYIITGDAIPDEKIKKQMSLVPQIDCRAYILSHRRCNPDQLFHIESTRYIQ